MTVPIQRDDLGFWVDSPDPLPCPPLRPGPGSRRARAQVAVVGAGFAGLSTAYELVRRSPGLDVVVVESTVAGAGASGRNTGILRPGVGGTVLDLCRRFGEDTARELYAASLSAVDVVRAIIAAEAIACDLEDVPHVKLALTSRQAAHLREEAQLLARLGFAADFSEAPSLPVPNRGGLTYPGSAQLNPALLVRGLKRAVLAHGVQIYEHTPVTALTPGRPVRLDLGGGATLVADRVVLATNAHTPGLGFLAGQVVPLQTHVGMTEPLTSTQLAQLDWAGRCSFSDKRQVFDYYRLTRGNSLVFGGGRPVYQSATGNRAAGATDVADPRVWQAQRARVARTFPGLTGLTIARQWAGTVGMTLDRFPVIGELAPGVIVAGGWSGHGVHLATASGALIADLVLERPNSHAQLPWIRSAAPRVPPDPMRAAGLRAYVRALQCADRLESLLDRKPIRVQKESPCQPVSH
jgi:gamma-glutamylputrescine oxidase